MTFGRIKARLQALPLFWKVYGFIVGLLIVVVALAEFILEPIAESLLAGIYGGFRPWHEAVIWAITILLPSLACGYILSKILSVKLNRLVKASRTLARGNLEVRLPAKGNDKDSFDVLARSFNDMAEAIETQRQNGRRLLADISHELRSPLTRMTVATELLNRRHTDETSLAITLRLEKEVSQMNEMVALLLAQARDRLTSADNRVLDLRKILLELADDFAFQGEMRHIKIQTRIEGDLAVHGNAMSLGRMLGNILANAIFYSSPNSQVNLEARQADQDIIISIRDFGPGVSEDQLEDIFRAFYRVDSSRARTSGGAGLGLALAREAAIQHGGNIVAVNAQPGLRVTVTLPAYVNGRDG